MKTKFLLRAAVIAVTAVLSFSAAQAEDKPLRIGLVLPMTGPFEYLGRQVYAGVKLYMEQHGDWVAGRKIELLLRDDTGTAPETTKRYAQDLVTNDNAEVLAGFGLSPLAFAAAPVATQAKVPMVVMSAGASAISEKSPYIIRSGYTLVQYVAPLALWAAKNGVKNVYTLVTDYAPGHDAEAMFSKVFTDNGGTIAGSVRVPLKSPDYGPYAQRIKDANPGAVFAFVPGSEAPALMKQFQTRGLTEAGIKLICVGDVTDEDILDGLGDAAVGTITSLFYTPALAGVQGREKFTPENISFTNAFEKDNPGMRPDHMAVTGYDGMHLIYSVLEKTHGAAGGDAFVAAAKGMSWVSPRGPMSIDPETRDPIQDVYIRKVERIGGHLYNVDFDRIARVDNKGVPVAQAVGK